MGTNHHIENILYFGDNLKILKEKIKTELADVIYLDPPFNSNASYNILFKTPEDKESEEELIAFKDTWHWTNESEKAYNAIIHSKSNIAMVISGLREAIGENDMMAYLVMMCIRLIELHRVLKNTGSIFLHCDPTASHYLKIILDAIFGPKNFRNEIIWKKTNSTKAQTIVFGKQHDIIFWYSKSDDYCYNPISRKLDEKSKKPFIYDDNDGKGKYQTIALSNTTELGGFAKMKIWEWRGVRARWIYNKTQLDQWRNDGLIHTSNKGNYRKKDYLSDKEKRGILISDIWTDDEVAPIQSNEQLGFPTQKPVSLLKRIINASSNKGDIILDPFCGCGTTVHASQILNRKWIGIDITHIAIGLIEYRMKLVSGIRPKVIGLPITLESAQDLADRDKFQFEVWAVTRIDNIRPNEKKGKDGGIDGRGFIQIGVDSKGNRKYEQIIVSAKGGKNIGPDMIRDLIGVLTKTNSMFGIFICIAEPTEQMKKEAALAGQYTTSFNTTHPKVQIYTIKDYFDNKVPDLPQISNMLNVPTQEKTETGEQTTL